MKNYAIGKSTISGNGKIDENATYVKAKDYVGTYEGPKYVWVLGFIKTHSNTYDKDQYSLYCRDYVNGDKYILMNVPAWYGLKLEQDFDKNVINGNMSTDEFFDNTVIKKIELFKTKFNTESVNIIIDQLVK